ncbi:lysylphosphatidylglycerol synthase transmembrane domain-containing protein [Taibaiella koreensis]|uniref:lysylphosphatidylglycerol synthase transmembrane domain-containing protein n=1 Tax=Taibaiella koreensis TaxID=1268548 RepID=UPI000E59B585|nr:lysylphosphatidylglycerol synthase transmembrane domain-containing protein [Taibaiella koreensis]
MTKKTVSTTLQLIIFLGLGIGLIVWRYNAMNEEEKEAMFAAFRHVRWGYALPIFIIGFLSHFFRALRWKLILQPLDIYPSTANTTFSVLIGYLANTLVPRLGEVAKCTVLAKYEKVPADKLVGTIIAERAFDMVCLIAIVLLTLGVQYDVIYPIARDLYLKLFTDAGGQFIWARILIALGVLLAGIIVLVLLYRKIKNSKIGHVIKGIGEGLKAIALVRKKGLFLLYTLLIWTCYTGAIVVGYQALPETESLPLLSGLAVISFGSVGMIATPGGIGAYPVIVAQVLMLYGLSEGIGLAYGWVSWAAQTAIVLVLGMIALIALPLYNRKQHEAVQERVRTS